MNAKTILEGEMTLALQKEAERDELQQFGAFRPDGPTTLGLALEHCGRTEKEIRQIRNQIEGWPQEQTYVPVRRVLAVLVEHAINHYAEPPLLHQFPSEFETRTTKDELNTVLWEEGINRKELIAVAELIATDEHPEKFEDGYSDKEIHLAKIADVQKALSETLVRAASCWDMSDIEFHSGVAGFRISGGRITVGNGPGDVNAISQLLQFLKQSKPAPAEEVHDEPTPNNRIEFGNYIK